MSSNDLKSKVKEYPGFLHVEFCQRLISETRPRLGQAKIGRGKARVVHPARVALNYKYIQEEEWCVALRNKVATLLEVDDPDKVEPVEVVCYPKGGFYYRHNDSAVGDRPYSFMVALNEAFEGGELFFDTIGAMYTKIPTGMGLSWENTNDMTQESRPVREGEKWILCIWVNQLNSVDRANSGQDPIGERKKPSSITIIGENH